MKKVIVFGLMIVTFSLLAGIYLYPSMPDMMPSHWNTHGEIDDYMPKFWGLFLMPLITAFLLVLFITLPKLDPLKKNIDKFKLHYEGIIMLILIFLFYIYIVSLLPNVGITLNMNFMILPAVGLLMFFIGVLLPKCEQNWFIGIRNPWTLSSKKVWKKTHEKASIIFKIVGVLTMLGTVADKYAYLFLLIPLIIGIIYLFIYSYLEFKKESK